MAAFRWTVTHATLESLRSGAPRCETETLRDWACNDRRGLATPSKKRKKRKKKGSGRGRHIHPCRPRAAPTSACESFVEPRRGTTPPTHSPRTRPVVARTPSHPSYAYASLRATRAPAASARKGPMFQTPLMTDRRPPVESVDPVQVEAVAPARVQPGALRATTCGPARRAAPQGRCLINQKPLGR